MAAVPYTGVPTEEARVQAPDDLEHIEAAPGDFGAQVGEAGKNLGHAVIDTTKFYGTVAADNGSNNTLEQVTNILHGDPNHQIMQPDGTMAPDTGFFGKRGADAMSAAPEVQHQIDDIIRENRENLQTPEARLQYDVDTRRYRAQWLNEIGTHTDQEQKTWATDTNTTRANLALNSIARRPSDPTSVAMAQQQVRKSYVRNAQLAGQDTEGAMLKADQDVALARIRSLIVSDPAAAQGVFDKSGDVLGSRPDYDTISRSVKEAVINHQLVPAINSAVTQAKADATLMVGTPGQPQAGAALTETDAANAVRSAFPGAAITSQQRTPEHNAEVGGVPNSQHIPGQAIDFVLPKGTTFAQVKATMAAHGLPTTELINEGDHVHWAWGAKGGGRYPSTVDALRGTMDETLTRAQSDAVRMFPNYPDAQERYVEGVRRGLDQTIQQQEQQVTIDTHVVQQALAGDRPPISEDQLKSVSPEVAAAWSNVQLNNPYAAMHVENIFDANARGRANNLGTQFTGMMNRVLAPAGDPDQVKSVDQLWQYVTPGEDGPLTNTGLARLSDLLATRGTPQGDADAAQLKSFFDQAHKTLSAQVPELGYYDPKGEALFQKFLLQALPAIQAERSAGKSLSQILAPKGDLYNSIYTFKRPLGEDIKDRILDTNRVNLGAITADQNKAVLDPAKAQSVDRAIQQKQFTADQGAKLKALMLDVQIKRLTPAQAKEQAIKAGIFAPDVPLPGG